MNKIEHPKVFISYAWTDDEFSSKVASFVNRLRQDGIDTVFDQTDLKFGNSMIHFMESSVHDANITNVLLLLTPEYKEKADLKKGGVGTETQIISAEVYEDVGNTKFIPIIFDTRGRTFKDCLPIYLKTRYFIDLSNIETYENNYNSLVRTLYGVPSAIKQPLGSKPEWVDNPESLNYNYNTISALRSYTANHSDKFILYEAKKYASNCLNQIKSLTFENEYDPKYFKGEYGKLIPIRNTFLNLVYEIISNEDIFDYLLDFFESLTSYIKETNLTNSSQYKATLLIILKHELIISCIALLFKANRYSVINRLISSSYISYTDNLGVSFNSYFYSYSHSDVYNFCENLNVSIGNNRKLVSGLADYWVHNTCTPLISAEDFVNADILISNISYALNKKWFPKTYIYASWTPDWLRKIAVALTSKSLSMRLLPLFGVDSLDALKNIVEKLYVSAISESSYRGYTTVTREYPLFTEILNKNSILTKP